MRCPRLVLRQADRFIDSRPDFPGDGQTDPVLVANCFLLHVTRHMSGIANTLGKAKDAKRFHEEFDRLLPLFLDEYVTKNGRIVSDSQTALALALRLKLLNPQQQQNALTRLDNLIRSNVFKVGTRSSVIPRAQTDLGKSGWNWVRRDAHPTGYTSAV